MVSRNEMRFEEARESRSSHFIRVLVNRTYTRNVEAINNSETIFWFITLINELQLGRTFRPCIIQRRLMEKRITK